MRWGGSGGGGGTLLPILTVGKYRPCGLVSLEWALFTVSVSECLANFGGGGGGALQAFCSVAGSAAVGVGCYNIQQIRLMNTGLATPLEPSLLPTGQGTPAVRRATARFAFCRIEKLNSRWYSPAEPREAHRKSLLPLLLLTCTGP